MDYLTCAHHAPKGLYQSRQLTMGLRNTPERIIKKLHPPKVIRPETGGIHLSLYNLIVILPGGPSKIEYLEIIIDKNGDIHKKQKLLTFKKTIKR